MIKAIAFTLYPVRDMKRAWDFHEETLGLRLASREVRDFEWVEYDLEGDTFALTNFANAGIPGAATVEALPVKCSTSIKPAAGSAQNGSE